MRLISLTMALVFAFFAVPFATSGDWFDMEKCDMCKPLMEEAGLLEHMKWNHYNVKNGIVSVTVVDEDYLASFERANKKMKMVMDRITQGEELHFCNMCNELGSVFDAGANWERVESGNVVIGLTTSDDPALVQRIQAWGSRTNQELKEMMEKEMTAKAKKKY